MAQAELDKTLHPTTDTADTTETSATVTTASTSIVSAKKSRRFLYLVNDSTSIVYLSFGGTAQANKGIRLNASGGSLTIDLHNLYTGAITGIVGSGTAVITVIES